MFIRLNPYILYNIKSELWDCDHSTWCSMSFNWKAKPECNFVARIMSLFHCRNTPDGLLQDSLMTQYTYCEFTILQSYECPGLRPQDPLWVTPSHPFGIQKCSGGPASDNDLGLRVLLHQTAWNKCPHSTMIVVLASSRLECFSALLLKGPSPRSQINFPFSGTGSDIITP